MHEHSPAILTNRPLGMAVLGDSLAYGLGASANEFGMAQRLFLRLRERRPGSTLLNLGVPHATMGDVLRHQVPQMRGRRSEIVLLVAGANDLRYTRDAIVFARRFRHLLDAVHRSAPRAAVIAAGMPDVTQTIGVPKLVKPAVARICRRLNATMQTIAAEYGDHFLDLFTFTNEPLSGDPACLLCADGYHPNDDGYAQISERAYPVFDTALESLP